MPLDKINNFANDDTDILALQTTVDALYQNSYSLTEYDSTTVPAIAAGSKIEVNGSLYRAATEEAISTTDPVTSSAVADGTIYICMIPSGDASTCTAAFTATAPTWSDSKQGWYGTGDYANYKYLNYVIIKATASYKKYTGGKFKNRFVPYISYNVDETPVSAYSITGIATSSETMDALGEVGADSVTISKSGLYLININMKATSILSASRNVSMYVIINSSTYLDIGQSTPPATGGTEETNLNTSFIYNFISGDTLSINIATYNSDTLGQCGGRVSITQLY